MARATRLPDRRSAAGRPAIVQWTGEIPEIPEIPGDAGLLRFRTPAEAERDLRDVIEHYPLHSAAARQLAERVFSAERVVAMVLERI
jgi:hypothetical protein